MGSSMYQTFKPKKVDHFIKTIPDDIFPIQIDWGHGNKPATINFSDGKFAFGSCIRCAYPRCIEYSYDELKLSIFQDFPADQNNNVCPTNAISWPHESSSPVINTAECINCGLCVSRCPSKAIYLLSDHACINDTTNDYFIEKKEVSEPKITEYTSSLFNGVVEKGLYVTESDAVFETFYNRFVEIAKNQSAQFPNHLARNLLIANGVGAAMRRRGDTNIRMDLVLGPPGVKKGTSEVEFGNEILDAPRNILDNIAVLVARYELSKDMIVPVIVSLSLPNSRSEYFRFIQDVRKVLNIKINSITIGGLILLIWNRSKINFVNGDELYIDETTSSLRPKLEEMLGRPINLENGGYPGLLDSAK
jgi:ferredoxin